MPRTTLTYDRTEPFAVPVLRRRGAGEMTADLTALIGRIGRLTIARPSIQVDVLVRDARVAYGRTDLLVEPAAGSGSDWVARSSVAFPGDAPATAKPVARQPVVKKAVPSAWRKSK